MKRKKTMRAALALCLAGLVGTLIWALDLPHWQRLDLSRLERVRQASLVFDASGAEAGALYGSENRRVIALSGIPEKVRLAFIAAEDLRFYRHHGVDVRRVFGALWQDLKSLSFRQGASTITQQLIKLTHLTSEKTLARKAQEAVLALQLERVLSKDEILEAYLNIAYFGSGAYGIEAAAQTYFGKSAAELTVAEGALLAGIVKSPTGYAPNRNPERALTRRNSILNTMEAQGFITGPEADAARNSPLALAGDAEAEQTGAAWYLDAVLSEAQEALGLSMEEVLAGGYRIHTALDPALQAGAEALFADAERFPPDAADGTPVQAALTCLDPATGEVRALIGGRSYTVRLGLNRATQIARQPGSAIKPISAYAAAVDHYGYVPSSFVDDTRRAFAGGYAPRNAGDAYHGPVTLREALARSLNVATVDLAERIGVESVCAYAERFGIELDPRDGNLSLALGSMTRGVSPLRLCAAYGALANGGVRREAHLIRRIENSAGREIYVWKDRAFRAVSPETACLITDMLKTAATSGSARALADLDFPVAAKTGTVSQQGGGNRDAWIAAYTPDLAVCVWMGFDQPDAAHVIPGTDGGGSYPARLAAALLGAERERLSGADFAMPEGLRVMLIDRLALETEKTVALAAANTPGSYAVRELFYKNSLPAAVSDLWDAPARVYDLRLESGAGETPVLSFTALDENAEYLLLRETEGIWEIAATLTGEPGAPIRFADVAASANYAHEYKIIPRHRLLYAQGVLLTGEESPMVAYQPGGLLNRLSGLWQTPPEEEEEAPEGGQSSIFG